MNDASPVAHTNQFADQLFRREAGKLVAIITRIMGMENLELAEDVIQDTFLTAIKVWPLKGVPGNPSAWLMQVAKNKAIDVIRKNKFSRQVDFSDPEKQLLQSEYTLVTQLDKLWKEDEVEDDLLRMMFACCNEKISPESQITLMLKTLCGFSTTEIAKAFMVSEDTISKRLYRARQLFREEKIRPEFPRPDQLQDKTGSVLKAIYLIFNEGYNSTDADELIRKDLLGQAMYLCKTLCDNRHTRLPEVFAAMALMCFHASRIDSRISSEGEIILLSQQDRSKWNRELIDEGNGYMNRAAFGDTVSAYHIEAAIAYEHCMTPSFESTNWQRILAYYDILYRVCPAAIVALNRLMVVYKIKGPAITLEELNNSPYCEEWEKHYLYFSLLGEIWSHSDTAKATGYYQQAIALTKSEAEKKLLRKKIEELHG